MERFKYITNNTKSMAEVTISLRLDKRLHSEMKQHDEVNWSAVLRKHIAEVVENMHHLDQQRAELARKTMDRFRQSKAFSSGKSSVEVIREWREKR